MQLTVLDSFEQFWTVLDSFGRIFLHFQPSWAIRANFIQFLNFGEIQISWTKFYNIHHRLHHRKVKKSFFCWNLSDFFDKRFFPFFSLKETQASKIVLTLFFSLSLSFSTFVAKNQNLKFLKLVLCRTCFASCYRGQICVFEKKHKKNWELYCPYNKLKEILFDS